MTSPLSFLVFYLTKSYDNVMHNESTLIVQSGMYSLRTLMYASNSSQCKQLYLDSSKYFSHLFLPKEVLLYNEESFFSYGSQIVYYISSFSKSLYCGRHTNIILSFLACRNFLNDIERPPSSNSLKWTLHDNAPINPLIKRLLYVIYYKCSFTACHYCDYERLASKCSLYLKQLYTLNLIFSKVNYKVRFRQLCLTWNNYNFF